MRVNLLFNLRPISRFFYNLLGSSSRKFCVPVALKNITRLPSAEVCPQLLSQLRQNRNITAFSALAFFNQNHLLVEKEIFDLYGNKLGDARSGQKKCFQQQSVLTFIPVSLIDEFLFFIARQSLHDRFPVFSSFDGKLAANFLSDVASLVVSQMIFSPQLGGRCNQFFERFLISQIIFQLGALFSRISFRDFRHRYLEIFRKVILLTYFAFANGVRKTN